MCCVVYHSVHVKGKGELARVSSLLLCWFWGCHSGFQDPWQPPIPADPSRRPGTLRAHKDNQATTASFSLLVPAWFPLPLLLTGLFCSLGCLRTHNPLASDSKGCDDRQGPPSLSAPGSLWTSSSVDGDGALTPLKGAPGDSTSLPNSPFSAEPHT